MLLAGCHQTLVLSSTFINAQLDISIGGVRLFTAMLARTRRDKSQFEEICLPARYFLASSNRVPSGDDYKRLDQLLTQWQQDVLQLPHPVGSAASATPRLLLLAHGYHQKGPGRLHLKFADALHPYLLQQTTHFTRAPLTQLRKLKTLGAFRLYWLLREYAAFGERTLELAQLKWVFGLSENYYNVTQFINQVLKRAQQELANTDLAFTLHRVEVGRRIHAVRFCFAPPATRLNPTAGQAGKVTQPGSGLDELLQHFGPMMWLLLGGWAIAFVISRCLIAAG